MLLDGYSAHTIQQVTKEMRFAQCICQFFVICGYLSSCSPVLSGFDTFVGNRFLDLAAHVFQGTTHYVQDVELHMGLRIDYARGHIFRIQG